MTEEQFIKHYDKTIKILLNNGKELKGFCSSFCRSFDDPNGKTNITVDTEDGYIVVNYEDVKEIKIITP